MQKPSFLLIFAMLCIPVLFAQDINSDYELETKQEFFLGLNGSMSLYSADGFSYGGGLKIGFGTGTAIGLNIDWFFSTNEINTLEINLFLRFYLFGKNASSGPFLQLMGGPSLFFQNGHFHIPGYVGEISGGLGFGWRFVIANRLFLEPFIRGGYPYLAGGGITVGVRL